MDDDRPVYFAGRQMTVGDLHALIDVLRRWLKETDKEQKFSMPNGHIWNAIDVVEMNKRG
jgi:hypothetical protein